MKALLRKIRQILRDRRTRRFLTRFVSGVAAIVVFVTTYALVLPAITMESEATCGIEAHQHDDSCYSESLICGQEESDGHHHTEDCYTVTKELECQIEEHQHSSENGCFDEEGNLVCKLEEHTHSDSCYKEHRELTCGLEESEGHHHTDSCYTKVLTCGKEVHTHSAACYKADLQIEAAVASTGMTSAAAVPDLSEEDIYTEDSEHSQNDASTNEALDEQEQADADKAHADDGLTSEDDSEDEIKDDTADIRNDEKDKGSSEEGEEAASSYSTGMTSAAAVPDLSEEDIYTEDSEHSQNDASTNEALDEQEQTDADKAHADDDLTSEDDSEDVTRDDTVADIRNDEKDKGSNAEEEEDASSFSTGFAADEAAENGDAYIPEKDALDFNTVLNHRTGIYYHHVKEDEADQDSSVITEWAKVDEDTELNSEDLIRMYLSYTLPKDTINATNDISRYRLPDALRLTDEQINAINTCENGISAQYINHDALEITDPDRHAAYLGLESVEGTRCPDEELKEDSQEFISAVVRAEKIYDEETGEYAGTDLVFTFSPYTVEKNAHAYDKKGQPTKAGEEVTGWLTLDFNMGQIEWAEDNTSEIIFAEEDKENDISEIKTVLRQADPADAETDNSAANGATEAAAEYATEEAAASATTAETAAGNNTADATAEAATAATTSETAAESTSEQTDAKNASENEKDNKEESAAANYPAAVFDDSITVRSGHLDTDLADTNLPRKTKMTVHVEADEGTFPKGTKMVLSAVEDLDAVAEAVGTAVDAKTRGFQAVDITFYDKDPAEEDAKEIEPLKPIRVSIKSDEIKKAAEDATTAPVVVHIEDDNTATEIENTASKTDSAAIEIEKPGVEAEMVVPENDSKNNANEEKEADDAAQVNDEKAGESSTKDHNADKETDETDSSDSNKDNVDAGLENEESQTDNTDADSTKASSVDSADAQEDHPDNNIEAGEEDKADADIIETKDAQAENTDPAADNSADGVTGMNDDTTDDAVNFEADSFSIYAVVYTVDFHWEVDGKIYEFSIPGGGFISFESLMEILGVADTDKQDENSDKENNADETPSEKALTLNDVEISETTRQFVSDVEKVDFSDPGLVWVGKVDEETTVGHLKEANKLEVEYSGELTEEQIEEINAQTVHAGDWALISMLPFDTEESLTVTMKNGEVFTVRVTDARDPLGLDDRTVAFVVKTSNNSNAGVSVQSQMHSANTDLIGRSVTITPAGHIEYCDEDASVWLFEYDENQKAYYISNGWHTDGSTKYLTLHNDKENASISLETDKDHATPVKIEKDEENGTYRLYVQNGENRHYLTYNPTYQTFYSHGTSSPDGNCNFHFCLPEESGTNASHKATLISAQDVQHGQRLVIYQRVWGKDANNTQVAYYYAISADGTLVRVENSSDSIYWKGDKNIEWEINDLGNGYYTLSGYNSQGQKVYLVPKNDGFVFSSDYAAFKGDKKHLSISLPGRDVNNTYTSQISSWDYNAYTTFGLKVTGTTTASGTTTAIAPVEYLQGQEFYFASRDPIVQGELTEVDTVSSKEKGITIQMYDFSGDTKTKDYIGKTNTDGNRLQFMTDVLWDDEWLPYELHQGLTERVLVNGWPVSTQSEKSLSEIFNSSNSTYKGEADHLFLQNAYNETGFYKYSCFENYAYFNETSKNFSVYEQIGTPYAPGGGSNSRWNKTNNFGQTYYWPEDGTYSSGAQAREGAHNYYKRGNFMPYNTLNPNSKRDNLYDPDLIPLDSNDPRRNEDLYVINGSGDYFFGMVMSAKFIQNPGGLSDNGDPMVFEFNGDDDMWVYVDDVLLLDMGGVHDAFRGKIDFNTGDIYVNGQIVLDTTKDKSASSNHAVNPHTTIKEQFFKAHKYPDGSDWPESDGINSAKANEFFSGNTFKDFTTHNFKMFYMERGAGASNLEMQFNLPVLTESQFRVKKAMPESQQHEAIQSQYADATFYYEAWVKDTTTNQMTQVTRAYLNQLKQQEKIKDATPRYDDKDRSPVKWKSDALDETKFELKPGMTALFPAADDSLEWYVTEVEPEAQSNMLDFYKVSNSDQDTTVTNGTKSNQKTILKRNTVTFFNRPDDKLVNDLRITKDIIGKPYDKDDAFEIRVFLEATNGKMVPYSWGEYYLIDKNGKYVSYNSQGQRQLSDTPVLAEHTSTNGTIGDFREGDTIIIKGLLEGTDFYVYERTDYSYMSKDETPAAKTYAFIGTDVEDAYIRANGTTPAQNVPEHLTGHLFDEPTGLPDLFAKYNTSDHEQNMAATGAIIQNKDAKVLVKNKPSDLIFEKKWVLKGGDVEYTPTDADQNITVTATLKGTKTTTTTTYEEVPRTITETQYVDDDLVTVTLVRQDQGYYYWGYPLELGSIDVRKGSTLWFSVATKGTSIPQYWEPASVVRDESKNRAITYIQGPNDQGAGHPCDVIYKPEGNVYKLENITESTVITAHFANNTAEWQGSSNRGYGYFFIDADTTPNKVPVEVTTTIYEQVPHTETTTETSEKVITLNEANGWTYDLNNDPDAVQGWSYVIDPSTIEEHNATGYNFISTPVITTDEEGNVTYTCKNEKQTTINVEKDWSPKLSGTDADGAYVNVELHRYVKLRGAFTVRLTTDDQEPKPIQGATFTLYKLVEDGDDIEVQTNLTDENGEITVVNLEPGTYYYVQTGEANGYSMTGHTHQTESFTVTDDDPSRQTKTVTLTNSASVPVGAITLTLKDNTGAPIQGATFQLYKNGAEVSGAVYSSNEHGIVNVTDLGEGSYFLRQLTTPADYKMPHHTDTETLVVDQPGLNSAEWEMTNTCNGKGTITVTLQRADNSNPIPNAGFTLYKDNVEVDSGVTNNSGQITFGSSANKLEAGEYTLVQTSTASDLVKAAPKQVTIEDNGDPDQHVQTTVTNVKASTGTITINLYRAQGNIVDPNGGRIKQNAGEDTPYAVNRNYKPGDVVTVKVTSTGSKGAYCTDYTIESPWGNDNHEYWGTFKPLKFVDGVATFTFEIPSSPSTATYNLATSSEWGLDALELEFVNPPNGNRNAGKLMSSPRKNSVSTPLRAGDAGNDDDNSNDSRDGNGSNTTTAVVPNKPAGYIEDPDFEVQTARLTANGTDPTKNWKHLFTGLDMTDSDGNPYYYYIVETDCHPEFYHVSAYSDAVNATAADKDRKLTVTNQAVGKIVVKKTFMGVTEEDLPTLQNGLIVTVTGPNAGGDGVNTKTITWSDGLATGVTVDNLVLGEDYDITESFANDETTQAILAKYVVVSEGTVDHFDDVVSLIHPGTNDVKELVNKYRRGSLKINKEVQKNGTTDSADNGTYWFAVYAAEDVNPAVEATNDTPAVPAMPKLGTSPAWKGSVTVNGGTGNATAPDLYLGDYYVFELTGEFGDVVTDGAGIGGKYYSVTGSGSTATVSADHLTDQEVTVTNNFETTSKTATKTWNDSPKNTNPVHPTIYFKLYYRTSSGDVALDGAELKELEHGITSVTWSEVPKYDENGNEYEYLVKEYVQKDGGEYVENDVHYTEAAPNGYLNTELGLTVTNTQSESYDPRTSYSGRKIWVDTTNNGATRPGSIPVKLMIDKTGNGPSNDDEEAKDDNGDPYEIVWVKNGDVWTYTFSKLPVYDANKNIIHYYAVETPVTGYDAVEPVGQDDPDDPDDPEDPARIPTRYQYLNLDSIQNIENDSNIELNSDIEYLPFVAIRTREPAYGKTYHIWTIRALTETEKSELLSIYNERLGRELANSSNTRFVDGLPVSKTSENNVEYLYRSDDNHNGYKVLIYKTQSSTLKVEIRGSRYFADMYVGTLKYDYYAGSTVFSNKLQTTDYDVQKNWGTGQSAPDGAEVEITLSGTIPGTVTNDNPNPDPVPIELGTVGVTKTTIKLNGGKEGGDDTTTPWTYSWTGLPQYDSAGHEITYRAAETSYTIDGNPISLTTYAPSTTPEGIYELVVTNQIPTTTFAVNKRWVNDNSNIPPAGATITATLFKGTSAETAETEVSSIILNGKADYNGANHVEGEPGTENAYEDTPWHAQWKNLPVYGTDGKRITYVVKETVAYEGYTVSYEKLHGNEGDVDKDYALNSELITNSKSKYDFDILKVREGTTTPLPEASFTIRPIEPASTTSSVTYVSGSEESNPVTTGDGGKTRFQDIALGYYEVRETVPPAGYVLTLDPTFYIKIETTGIKLLEKEIVDGKLSFKEAQTTKVGNVTISTEDTTVLFTVENTPGAALPESGGPGTRMFTILGTVLLAFAGMILIRRRRTI